MMAFSSGLSPASAGLFFCLYGQAGEGCSNDRASRLCSSALMQTQKRCHSYLFETAYAPKSFQVSARLNSAPEQGQNSAIWGEVFCNCCRYRRGSYFDNEPSIQKRQRYPVFDSKT